MEVILGSLLPSPVMEPFTIWSDDPELAPHLSRPWLRAYATAQLGADDPVRQDSPAPMAAAVANLEALQRHAVLFGSTGTGKSRLALHLIAEQLRQGCSVVAIDPKPQTISYLAEQCRRAGLTPEQLVVVSPGDMAAGVPGWNPLLTGVPPEQAAGDLVATLSQSTDSWGPRLSDILSNALIVLSAHRLSLYELPRLLTRADYRAGLLRLNPARTDGGAAYAEARDFFAQEFSTWSRAEQSSAVAPVLNKTRALLRSDFFQALFCARENTLDFASLWHRPGAVLVHLDRTSLGDDGARLLGGLIAHHLYRMAMRASGPVPVVLALDELGDQEKFIGQALKDILNVARTQNLRLLAATQYISQLSEGLRQALLTNAGVRVFFRMGLEDARLIAAFLSAGSDEPLRRATASVKQRDRLSGLPTRRLWSHTVRDTRGNALKLSTRAWETLRREDLASVPGRGLSLRRVERLAARAGVSRLYVDAADTGRPIALSKYVEGLSETEYWFDGPAPLSLIVSVPLCQFTHAARSSSSDQAGRWVRTLQNLPIQHAVVALFGGLHGVIRAVDVDTRPGGTASEAWYRAAQRARSVKPADIAACMAWRSARVEETAQNRAVPDPPSPPRKVAVRIGSHEMGNHAAAEDDGSLT